MLLAWKCVPVVAVEPVFSFSRILTGEEILQEHLDVSVISVYRSTLSLKSLKSLTVVNIRATSDITHTPFLPINIGNLLWRRCFHV